jgi:single stranded DNA-binding protein
MLNRVVLEGKIDRDPIVSLTEDGKEIVNFSLATTQCWKDKAGEWQSTTDSHNVTIFRKSTVGWAKDVLKQGDSVHVEGALSYHHWVDRHGQNRSTAHVCVAARDGQVRLFFPSPSVSLNSNDSLSLLLNPNPNPNAGSDLNLQEKTQPQIKPESAPAPPSTSLEGVGISEFEPESESESESESELEEEYQDISLEISSVETSKTPPSPLQLQSRLQLRLWLQLQHRLRLHRSRRRRCCFTTKGNLFFTNLHHTHQHKEKN